MAAPIISKEKRQESLEKARFFRAQRSKIKKSIKNGNIKITEIFNEFEKYADIVAKMKILDILMSFPQTGETRAKKILSTLLINERKNFGGLGKKQKENLKKYFQIQ